MKKILLKATSVILMLTFIVGAVAVIVYPKIPDLKLYAKSYEPTRISKSVALSMLTELNTSYASNDLGEALGASDLAVEAISPEVLAQVSNSGQTFRKVEPYDTELAINTADIDGKVFDGEDAFTMEKGFWHFPLSVGAGDKGNFIIFGHRFAKIPPETDTFFNLDKVKIGDKINITQADGIEYTYTVVNSRVVDKYDRSILQKSDKHMITLVTCAPLWSSDQRLVVTGILDKEYQKI